MIASPVDTAAPATGAYGTAHSEPTVLAVVVAHRPGEWFRETLESLALQDYGPLSVTVVDAAGSGIGPRVAEVLADAAVIDAAGASGFSEAANAVLSADLHADFLLVCHDDVALAPDAVSTLVVEALRSNAGIVGPKIVEWDRPEIIRHAGYDVDRFGVPADRAGAHELDQEQHDGVRDAFALPSAVLLIRGDLFARLGGFDAGMTFRGEDVDLCWRAQMAGARVMFVGGAVARHRGGLASRTGVDDVRLTQIRHALRSMLVNHGRLSLAVFVPLAVLMAISEVVLGVFTAHFGRARDVVSAWVWNISRLDVVLERRRANTQVRRVRQADVTALQYLGSVRLVSFLRRQFGGESPGLLTAAGRGVLGGLRTGTIGLTWIAWAAVVAVVLFGSRRLVADGVPAVGDFVALGETASDLIRTWWGGWSQRNAGAPSSNLGVLVYLGAAGWLLSDSMGLVRTLSVVAPILVGLLGAYRLLAATGSRRAQAGTLVAYLLVPLASASVAGGSIPGLVGYAAAPWMLRELLRASRTAPFRSSPNQVSLASVAVPLGAVAGLAALVVPAAVALVVLLAAGLVLGSLLAARPGSIPRLLAAAVLAVPTIAFVALPTVVDVLASGPSWGAVAGGRDGSAGEVSFGEMLRFAVGPGDPGSLVWLFAVPMAVPLLLGRGWRLEQSIRLWMVALAAWALALASQRGALPFGLPDLQLLLAPAAVSVAALCGMAVLSIEHDLRFSHFGWRQALVPITVAASLLLAVGRVGVLETGSWDLVEGDHHAALRFEPPALAGAYRVLWIGAPEFLAVEGHSLAPGVAWAATTGDSVTIADRALPLDEGQAGLFETVIDEMDAGRTTRGGRLLAGLGVRYVVLLHRLAPAPFAGEDQARPVPAGLASAIRHQLDLELVEGTNSAVDMFVNTSWVPMRAVHAPGFDRGVDAIIDLEAHPITAGAPVFSGAGPPWSADIPDEAEVLVAHTPRPGWQLTVNGETAPRREALSWARAYLPAGGGEAELSYSSPWWRRGGQLVGAAAPVVLLLAWLRRRMGRP